MTKQSTLAAMDFGQRIAEEEGDSLAQYFVETDNWNRLFGGSIDIVYGPKGSGKSALYTLLIDKTNALFDRQVILVPGEKPRGTPAFRNLSIDPPATEMEFVSLWKLYFLTLIAAALEDYGFGGANVITLRHALEDEGLLEKGRSLSGVLSSVLGYVKRVFRPSAIEGTVAVDPNTGMPIGFGGKISFQEPSPDARKSGVESVDHLLALADRALEENGPFSLWLLLDRLDVAFAESPELERNALRALFRVYLDLGAYDHLTCKIFLRTDIWNRILREGFREASHITKSVTISWNRASLLNLIIRRAIHNPAFANFYKVDAARVLDSSEEQERLYFRMCPQQIDIGPNKPTSLDWMLSRTRDSSQHNAPRELIHFLNTLRSQQMRKYEIGDLDPEGETLFARATFKESLPEVSRVRLEQTLYAEFPDLRNTIELLRRHRTLQRTDSLARILGVEESEAEQIADRLVEVGLFEKRGAQDNPEYWVPFLYRDALDMVQGAED